MQQLLEKLSLHEKEHKDVFKKETLVLRNDLYYRFFEHRRVRWFVDISYRPKQTPGGDTYSIRRIGESTLLIMIVDAMGKGITASITSILSSAFLNHRIDVEADASFELSRFIQEYQIYISKHIFDDEAVSCSFLLCDFAQNKLEYALFGMPPILLCDEEERITKLRANNLPMTRFTQKIQTDVIALKKIYKILLYSDGLNEARTRTYELYRSMLAEDFKNAPNYKHFLRTVLDRIEAFDDDMTFIFLERERCESCTIESFSIPSKRDELDRAIVKMERFFHSHSLEGKELAYMMQACTEILFNAYEHGNLCIDAKTKQKEMEAGRFDAYARRREQTHGHKPIHISLHAKEGTHLKTFKADILDQGEGFDTAMMRDRIVKKSQFNGRGVLMASKLADAFYYNETGNRALLKKFIYKETPWNRSTHQAETASKS